MAPLKMPVYALLLISSLAAVSACGDRNAEDGTGAPPVGILTTADNQGYLKAMEPLPLDFPADHGAHPGYRIEWWYFTGNLVTAAGREFGYQFTLFRNALSPRSTVRDSAWATNQVFMAHAALTDINGGGFYHHERYSRGGTGLAGVSGAPFHAWLEDWSVTGEPCAGDDCFAAVLELEAAEFELRLSLESTRSPVLHGDRGLSAKSGTPGNASFYYSYPRIETRGRVRLKGTTYPVIGASWMDHEWSSSMLEQGQTGWDWFSLQLSGGIELMIFRVRHRDPAGDFHSGTLVHSNGLVEILDGGDYSLHATDTWRSRDTGSVYPAGWTLSLPAADLELEIIPKLAAQELDENFKYWEGAVRVTGTRGGRPIQGQGYVELTGY